MVFNENGNCMLHMHGHLSDLSKIKCGFKLIDIAFKEIGLVGINQLVYLLLSLCHGNNSVSLNAVGTGQEPQNRGFRPDERLSDDLHSSWSEALYHSEAVVSHDDYLNCNALLHDGSKLHHLHLE